MQVVLLAQAYTNHYAAFDLRAVAGGSRYQGCSEPLAYIDAAVGHIYVPSAAATARPETTPLREGGVGLSDTLLSPYAMEACATESQKHEA